MTKDQLRQGKFLRQEIKGERRYLAQKQFDAEVGGRRGEYAEQGPGSWSDARAADAKDIEHTKQRIAALEARFAAL